ncbi:hypothetical protein HMPREF1475_00822 [Hoylesella oralis HGA0225]|nr:hypothetical protein HMPREF1475_00822 [Hoylesella oralis HGA0225]SHF70974.1 hypothetical protein SAMN05444288_1293 [Hoylesella oralis]
METSFVYMITGIKRKGVNTEFTPFLKYTHSAFCLSIAFIFCFTNSKSSFNF